jgi:hypothetical protein
MIRHVVQWKLAAADEAARDADAREVQARLLALKGVVPSLRSIEVGINSLYPESNWHVVLLADFDSAEDLAAYQDDPRHQEAAAFVRSVVSARASVDFEA